MTIYFGVYTLYGLLLGVMLPYLFGLFAWLRDWFEYFSWMKKAKTRSHEENRVNDLSYSAHATMFNTQYYPVISLQSVFGNESRILGGVDYVLVAVCLGIQQPFFAVLPIIVIFSPLCTFVGLIIDNIL